MRRQGRWRGGSPELRHRSASKVYNDCGIPHVTGAATNPDLTKPGYNTTYRIIATDVALSTGLAFLADSMKLKSMLLLLMTELLMVRGWLIFSRRPPRAVE